MRQRGIAVFYRKGRQPGPRVRGEIPAELPQKYACLLHDTVLATLTAIASGQVDHRADEVRRRCARDADHLRRMLAATPDDGSGTADRIAAVVTSAEALGLRVHLRQDALPALPEAVRDAVVGAAEEALNNVARHAGVREAWLTLSHDAGTLVVRAVDRGADLADACLRDPRPASPRLSAREKAVLVAYASGMTLESAARHLGMRPGTAKTYLDRIKAKYTEAGRAASTKLELADRARADGLLPGGPFPGRPTG